MFQLANYLLSPENENFVLIAHTSPDGDTLGSAFALWSGLKKLGKNAEVVCDSRIPANLKNLPFAKNLRTRTKIKNYCAIAIDAAEIGLLGNSIDIFQKADYKIVIDHHCTNLGYGDLFEVQPEAAATGEIIWELLEKLGIEVDIPIAELLYTALATDTGNFSYSNTTPKTLKISAKILEAGFDLPKVNEQLFRERTFQKTKLIGLCIDNIELYAGDQVAISCITIAQMNAIGVTTNDTEGVVDFLRDINTVEACAFIHEVEHNKFKISFRSKGKADVSKVAKVFGGGGHRGASGCKITNFAQANKDELLKELENSLLQ